MQAWLRIERPFVYFLASEAISLNLNGRDQAYFCVFTFDLNCRLVMVTLRQAAISLKAFKLFLCGNPSVFLFISMCHSCRVLTKHSDQLRCWPCMAPSVIGCPWGCSILDGTHSLILNAIVKGLLVSVSLTRLCHHINTAVRMIVMLQTTFLLEAKCF